MGNKVGNIGGACEGLEPVIKIVKNGILKYVCIDSNSFTTIWSI